MSSQSLVEYSNWSGTLILKWNRPDFQKIINALQLKLSTQNLTSVKTYYIRCTQPCSCKIVIYQNGRIMISNVNSYQNLQQVLAQQIFCILMQKLPDVEISVPQQLSITNCTAKITLLFVLNIRLLQKQIQKQYGYKPKGNYCLLPTQVHKVQKIAVYINKKQIKITKAHVIQDIYLFSKYLEHILVGFKQIKGLAIIQDIQQQWIEMKKNLANNNSSEAQLEASNKITRLTKNSMLRKKQLKNIK